MSDSRFNMNTQNLPQETATHSEIPAKRKRGRPRKDDNVVKRERPQMPITPAAASASDINRKIQHQQQVEMVNPYTPRIDHNNNIIQVGQTVSGVIEGTFDAGYFIAVRAGQSSTILRGVVFKPGCFVPVTPANDIAPNAKMYQRTEFGLPFPNLQNPANSSVLQPVQHTKQPAQLAGHSVAPMTANQVVPFGQQHFRPPFITVPPVMQEGHIAAQKNLRMVEQDDVMQVFEVSKPSDVPRFDSRAAKNAKLTVGSEIRDTAMESQIGTSKLGDDQMISPDQGFQEFHASMVSEPQTSELVHQEMKSPDHDPEEALLDGTTHSADCMPKSNELIQEINSAHLEVVPLDEGISVSVHAEIDNPTSSKINNQAESEVDILTKDGTTCSELAVEESGFQERSIEPQAAST